ncbi:MAG: carboxypeptidase regulatory-like domain-containing protein [Bacteroidetes bacterium]|nr:carboxypeptidase regulatory-like domain-containing protein [Bacteroidota bacterium]
MKTHILKFSAFVGVLLLLLTAFGASSCNKDKTTHGKIHVVDGQGAYVAGAAVHLSAPNSQVVYDGTTDGSGYVQFDVRLPAIFDVTASKDSLIGTGVLRLDEPGKTTELNVTVR